MNFLAHAYLSFNDDDVLLGNMMNDFIKGAAIIKQLPSPVQKGIRLHRAIDSLTDAHIATHKAKQFFKPAYRLYSGPLVDVVFDHFLAIDKNEFSKETLAKFAQDVYKKLNSKQSLMTDKFKQVAYYMEVQNWLQGYSEKENIYKSLQGLKRRSKYIEEVDTAFQIFNQNYEAIQNCFSELWPSLKSNIKNLYDDKTF